MITINDRDKLEWHQGMTVQNILDEMNYTYVLITVTVNGDLVPKEEWHHHSVPDQARVSLFHLHHGG